MPTKEDRKKRREAKKANRKPFNESGVGKFLAGAGSTITSVLGDVLPDSGVLSVIKNLIVKDDKLTAEDKEIALRMLEIDVIEMEEVTKRLQSDNEHNITRLVRPISYGCMFLLFMSVVFLDGNIGSFTVDKAYIPVINSLFGTMTIFYFGSRGVEKIMKTIYK